MLHGVQPGAVPVAAEAQERRHRHVERVVLVVVERVEPVGRHQAQPGVVPAPFAM